MPSELLEIGKEYPPSDEAAFMEQLRALHLKVHRVQPGPEHRGEHPKQHAGLWATFAVEKDLAPELRVGLFAEPRTFTALVRFSNGRAFDDTKPDVRGMATKVLVPQEGGLPLQQDFLTADHPVFFARNVRHAFEFLAATASGTPSAQLAMSTHPKLVGFTKPATSSLLAMRYWSQTPYAFGTGAVKYHLRPAADTAPAIPLSQSPDFLREALVEQLTLQKQPAQFDFCVQRQTDAAAMPVEDPTVEWSSEPTRLATLTIYPQRFDSPEQMHFVENLSWSPWNALPQHVPLGGINRVRRLVYQESSALRHDATGTPPAAPTGRESF
ncbi:MAG: hypothetical protein QOE70_4445 [Chthoniobacter sp.]|jgi:hypothetical protein|nr:hypothetical protein [Chthoniobacter sp.]